MKLKIALAQIDIAFGQPTVNFAKVENFIARASGNADVIVFPEMWNTGYALSELTELTELSDKEGKFTQNLLARLAKKYQINCVGGSVSTQKAEKFYNTSYIFDTSGNLVSTYDKVHLFGPMNEEKFIAAGNRENQFELAGVPSASVICYDIRFPEWLRKNMSQGAKILYVVAEWPVQRVRQWKILLQARAIENQAFVVAVNRVGSDLNNQFNGHSLIISPLGEIIVNAGENETLCFAEIDLSEIDSVRGEIPVFSDRHPELYH